MAKRHVPQAILDYLAACAAKDPGLIGADAITAKVGVSRPTINRNLSKLVASHTIVRAGVGPSTGYRLPVTHELSANLTATATVTGRSILVLPWSAQALTLRAQLEAPLGTRAPVSYQRAFVDGYVPNDSSLLPRPLAEALLAKGRAQGQQPAGTYARKVLEQLLIDLSWHSSRLEGNRKSLLDTKELFAKGRSPGEDAESTMLLNHKDAIEFLVEAVPEYGITMPVVRNLQALLMQGLLANPNAAGAIRTTVVNITNSVYVPTQVPILLEEMLSHIVEKARNIKNPVEAAFFLWVNIAYLQPFEDGNKRTSRLSANLPLLLSNCAPLSFLDVEPTDYAMAMAGVYERLDATLAVELFDWTYRRSIDKYRVVLDSMGAPDPFRAKYREYLGEAIQRVITTKETVVGIIEDLDIPAPDRASFESLLREELRLLETFNCARYRLSIGMTEEWIRRGRAIR